MRRVSALFILVLAVVLILPSVAVAADPIYLTPWDAPTPVPANAPLVVPGGWITMTRGLAQSAQTYNFFYFTVWDDEGKVVAQCTTDDSRAYWQPVYQVEDTEFLPFNPKLGAKQYLSEWRYHIADGLPAGDYTMNGGCLQTRPGFDLYWYYDGQRSPMRLDPGDYLIIEGWEFTVE